MLRAQTNPRFRRLAGVLLLLGALGLSTALLGSLPQPRPYTVAEAQTRLSAARSNLKTAMHIAAGAEALSHRAGGTNTALSQMVTSLGDHVFQKLQREVILATAELPLAEIVAAADHCVQTYADEASAQAALAALGLSGFKQVVIRPPGRSHLGDRGACYELLVPHDSAAKASAILQNAQICQLKSFRGLSSAFQARQALESQGIPASIRPMKVVGSADAPERLFLLFLLSADAEKAVSIIDGPSSTNVISFQAIDRTAHPLCSGH